MTHTEAPVELPQVSAKAFFGPITVNTIVTGFEYTEIRLDAVGRNQSPFLPPCAPASPIINLACLKPVPALASTFELPDLLAASDEAEECVHRVS